MEDENITSNITSGNNNDTMKEEEDTNVPLPGFRFHPTDEELVGFYLRRKVDNKKISLELIKHADIYKHDPWDLPKLCNSAGDKEWYFYCKRGRKYKNSVRPNRVTSSGFWKATGIDKPIYGSSSADHNIIGLKKSLVYYRGSSGKGTKTDWMMHEFRLPPTCDNTNDQEAEVWTLCRVFKRSSTASNYCKRSSLVSSDSRQQTSAKRLRGDIITNTTAASKTNISSYCPDDDDHHLNYISFNAPVMKLHVDEDAKPLNDISSGGYLHYYNFPENSSTSPLSSSDEITPFDPPFQGDHFNDMLSLGTDYNWGEDLRSLVSCDTVHANVVHPSFYVQ